MATIPLQLLAHCHARFLAGKCQIPDKIALLLSRGANVEARNHRGETSLHVVFWNHFARVGRYSPKSEVLTEWHLSESIDIIILMCSAGADVCAIDDQGRSVSDAAIDSGQEAIWTKALKYCGIDINEVLAHPNVNPARSTALSSRYNTGTRLLRSRLSLAEYLKVRKEPRVPSPFTRSFPWYSSSEDDDSGNEDYEDDESDYGDWDEERDNENFDDDDNESESGDSAEKTNRLSNGTKANCVPENTKGDFTYQEREKAKLD